MHRIVRLAVLGLGISLAVPASAQTLRKIGEVDLFLRGLSATVDPLEPVVPKNTASGVRVRVRLGSTELSAEDLERALGRGVAVEGDLAGPGLGASLRLPDPLGPGRLEADPLLLPLPPLAVAGDYGLTNLRLTLNGQPVLDVSPASVVVRVIDQVLITSVKTRPLTLDEIQERGIILDSNAYLGFEFTLGITLESEVVEISFPVVFDERGVMVPEHIRPPQVPTREGLSPTVVPVLLKPDLGPSPMVRLPGGGEVEVRIPSVLVIPGNVGFLKQFFEAQLFVANGAPAGSGLVVRNVTGRILLPAGADRVPGTSDDPLSLPDMVSGPQSDTLPVQGVGIDGESGTADDVEALGPTEQGQAEFAIRGEREGFHRLEFDISAVLEGLVTGPINVSGKASGGVLVRNPFFDLAFTVPAVVRRGELFKVFVTVSNISQSLANDVRVTLDSSRLAGAQLVGSPVQSIDTLEPRDAGVLEYELRAEETGHVVASYLRFDTVSGTTGDLRFTLGVGERGVVLSPDTLVLPTSVSRLPASVVEAAMRVLGQAWSIASAPAGSLPAEVRRTTRTLVTEKALALAEAGLRVELGQAVEDAVRDVLVDFYRSPTDPGFDQLLRQTDAGRDLARIVGIELRPAMMRAGGTLAFEEELARLAASGPDLVTFAVGGGVGGPRVAIRLLDAENRSSSTGDGLGPFQGAEVPGAVVVPLGAGPAPVLGWVARPKAFPYVLELEGRGVGAVDLAVALPQGNSVLRGTVRSLSVAPGGRYRVRLERFAASLTVEIDADGDGSFEAVRPLSPQSLLPQGPRFLSATVLGPETLSGASPFGFQMALLFDRVVEEGSAARTESYFIPGNGVLAAKRQLSGRLVFAQLAQPEGPYVSTHVSAGQVTDLKGVGRPSVTVPLGSRLDDPGAVVSGFVRQADGTPVPGAVVTYAQNPILTCVPPLDDYEGLSSLAAGADGRYELRYVRQDACGMPFKLLTVDSRSGAVREVTSSVRSGGERILLDITLLGKGAVEGTVRDLSGQPVAGAQVLVVSDTDPQLTGAGRSDLQGRYRVDGVAVGTLRVTAVKGPSLGRAAGRLDRSATTTVVDVTLDGGTVGVSGTVRRVERGVATPIPALQVVYHARDADGFVPVAVTQTSSAGEYVFEGMPTGEFRIVAALNARDQGETTGIAAAGDRLSGRDVLITLDSDGEAVVRGTVRLPGGSPTQAVVGIGNRGVQSGVDGRFELPAVPIRPLVPQALQARTRDGLRRGTTTVVVDRPEVEGVVVVLSGLGSAELTVLDAGGQPVAGQEVFLLGDCLNPCGCAVAETGLSGKARFENLPLGPARFRVIRVAPGFVDQAEGALFLDRGRCHCGGSSSSAGCGGGLWQGARARR